MTDDRAAARRIVLDLLVTWGATARPGMAELFETLSSFRSRDRLAILPRILELRGVDLGPELDGELRGLISASGGPDSLDPGFETRVERVLARARPVLRAGLEAQREALSGDLGRWTRVLAPAERDPILERYWRAGEAENLPGLVEALHTLVEVREMLDRSRERTETEIRALLDRAGASAGDSPTLERARGALASGDPSQLLAARRALTTITARDEHARSARELEAARQRLAGLCQRGRQALGQSDGALDESARGVLGTTLASSEELVQASAEPESPGDVAALTGSLAAWEASLEAMLDSPGAGGAPSAERQRAVAAAVAEEIGHLAPDDAQAREEARALLDAAAERGPRFLQALGRARSWIDSRQAESAAERTAAEEEMRAQATRLAAQLEKSATLLPTERIVAARALIEETDASIAGAEAEAMRSLGGRIGKETEQLRRLAERAEEYRSSRETAERKRIAREAKRLEGLARGREAKKLGALIVKIEGARPGELGALDARLRSVASRVGNRVRLEAARVARQADRQLQRKRGKPAAAELEQTAAALRAALEEDDLGAMAESSAALKGRLPKLSGTPVYAGIGALALIVLLGAFLVWRSVSGGTYSYQMTLAADEAAAAGATLMLVHGGNVFAEQPCRTGQPATFELPSGRYEVYVDGRYTGTVVHVPDDPPQVTGIPFPQGSSSRKDGEP